MDAARANLLALDPEVDEEVAGLLVRTADEVEARWRSAPAIALVTLTAALVAIGPHLPGARYVLGGVTGTEAIWVAAVAWCVFQLATMSFHVLGPTHPLSSLLSALDAFDRYAAFLALIYLSGSASSPLWLTGMTNAFTWVAKPPRRTMFDFILILTTHTSLAVAFLLGRNVGDAWLSLLVLLASSAGHTMSTRMVARTARVRAERDIIERRLREKTLHRDRERMARELHDGVGADVMALVLRLRRAAEGGTNPTAARLAEKARGLLDELRGVVWSLRNEQGTLAELGKLIDATCRAVHGGIAYERSTPLAVAHERIGPSAALAALSVAREFVRSVAARPGATKVGLTLSVADTLELAVEGDGESLSGESLAHLGDAMTQGHVEVSNLPNGAGVRLRATIALDQVA